MPTTGEMTSTPAPGGTPTLGGESVDDRFLVRDPLAVRQLLQQLLDEHCMLRVHAGQDPGVLSTIVRLDERVLWIDAPPTDRMRDEWLASAELRCSADFQRTEVRFRCGPPRQYDVDGYPTIALPLPVSLVHVQRREFVRREAPVGQLLCRIPPGDEGDSPRGPAARPVDAVVRDLSGGGVALLAPPECLRMHSGDELRGCTIELPGIGVLQVDLRVRHVVPTRHRGLSMRQIGCAFIDLSPAAQRRLFRYLMQLDRERSARERWG